MWELSAPGGDAEQCFMRVPQTDYLLDGRDEGLDWMPDVRAVPPLSLPFIPMQTSHRPVTP